MPIVAEPAMTHGLPAAARMAAVAELRRLGRMQVSVT